MRATYSSKWGEAIVCSLCKGSSKTNVKNFRGVSLLNVVSKIFTGIITERLLVCSNMNNILIEEQAGYKE